MRTFIFLCVSVYGGKGDGSSVVQLKLEERQSYKFTYNTLVNLPLYLRKHCINLSQVRHVV